MADYGHRETDELLAEMEKRVGSIYKQASEEMREKLAKWYKDFERLDKQKAALVEKGELPKADYLAWRKRKMVESGRLKALVDTLTEDYVNSDKIAMQIVRGNLTDVYALNANYAAYKIEQDANVNLSWTLYDHSTVERLIREKPEILPLPSVNVPLDERWNRQHLNIAITQGILQGESILHIGDRLQRILGMDRTAAIRSARTATTAAECAGRIDTYKHAKSLGIEMQQEWVATLDDRTRHEHRILDGQRVDIGEAFEVDGATIRYPGDPQAPGYLVYNCRCTLVSAVKGIDQSGAARASKLGSMSYEEWKAGKDLELQKAQKLELRQRENELKNEKNRAILKEKIDSGEIPLKLNKGQQRKHIEGTHEYKTYLAQRQKNGKTPQNIVIIDEKELDSILKKYAAAGDVDARKNPDGHYRIVEYVDTDIIVGQYFKNDQYHNSNRVAIHYSSRGEHIFPVPPKKE